MSLYLLGWKGIGDSIYLRPFVRWLAERHELYLTTPWPDLFHGTGARIEPPPSDAKPVTPYVVWDRSIPQAIARSLGIPEAEVRYDLPDLGPSPVRSSRPLAVVRPVTIRDDWHNPSRNPDPAYVAEAAYQLRQRGYFVVSVAKLGPRERALDPLPVADLSFLYGELSIRELIALVREARLIVGGVGWIVPAALAAGTPLICIGGGHGAQNAPERIAGPLFDTSRARFLLPDPYCRCARMAHDCPKHIPNFGESLGAALDAVVA